MLMIQMYVTDCNNPLNKCIYYYLHSKFTRGKQNNEFHNNILSSAPVAVVGIHSTESEHLSNFAHAFANHIPYPIGVCATDRHLNHPWLQTVNDLHDYSTGCGHLRLLFGWCNAHHHGGPARAIEENPIVGGRVVTLPRVCVFKIYQPCTCAPPMICFL